MSREIDLKSLVAKPGTILLDAQKPARESSRSLLFHSPVHVLTVWASDGVRDVLAEIQHLVQNNKVIVAGFIAYEAASAFDLTVASTKNETPLVWLGIYDQCVRLGPRHWLGDLDLGQTPVVSNGSFNVTREEFVEAVERARGYIAAGDTYQVNLTCKYRFDLQKPNGSAATGAEEAFQFYKKLRSAHPVPYGAFLNLGDSQVLSFSPELFLYRKGRCLTTRPMKGTAKRGLDCGDDNTRKRLLHRSEKDRAENVMIVDLMRNDFGRICETGTVTVPRLFDVERYDTVFQMTSTVEGKLGEETDLPEIFEATFPCGSITGAPKRRTMEIIAELEKEPRGPYCGAIGCFQSEDDFSLNVAIRTIVHTKGRCELGVGSGITWGSDPHAEWAETSLKSKFLDADPLNFSLIETLRLELSKDSADSRTVWEFSFLDQHLRRMSRSARYWGRRFPRKRIVNALQEVACDCASQFQKEIKRDSTDARVVRIALDAVGNVTVSTRFLENSPTPISLAIWPERVDSKHRYFYHKTDNRGLYNHALEAVQQVGFFEVLFVNEHDHLSEGSITNVFAEIEGRWLTPPISDGLLPGIWRANFLREKRALERPLTLSDLSEATRICVGNSVRGAIYVDNISSIEISDPNSQSVIWAKT
ncbi:MAG: aminodeoxychorismate synthase component I [Myxococcota bacterium]|nr:aminodeoxychorismate synthase component I [Myxococcota bacterium]